MIGISLLFPLLVLAGSVPKGIGGRDASRPKLLVYVSVDQLAARYIERFSPFLGPGGFRRLMAKGVYFSRGSYMDSATETGPGHSVLSTGTYPCQSGIVGNLWLEGPALKRRYCVGGTKGMSPATLKVPTFSDQWRKVFGPKSRIFSLSLKDRAAILLGGHKADYVGWGHSLGTSSYYLDRGLSPWGKRAKEVLRRYVKGERKHWKGARWEPIWNSWKPAKVHALLKRGLRKDDDPAEQAPRPWKNHFPHVIGPKGRLLFSSPFGNAFLVKAAEALLQDSVLALGRDGIPDLLLLSFSSNDYVGHAFGPDSWEVADTFLRLDRQLEGLMNQLDQRVGEGNYVLCLSADHGVAPIPGPGSKMQYLNLRSWVPEEPEKSGLYPRLAMALAKEFAPSLPEGFQAVQPFGAGKFRRVRFPLFSSSGREIYLRKNLLDRYDLDEKTVSRFIRIWLQSQAEVLDAASVWDLQNMTEEQASKHPSWKLFLKACYPGRSGDVFYALKPQFLGFLPRAGLAASHGTIHSYDREVPIFFYGAGVPGGKKFSKAVSVARMVPTAARLFGIAPPSSCREAPLSWKNKEEIKKK